MKMTRCFIFVIAFGVVWLGLAACTVPQISTQQTASTATPAKTPIPFSIMNLKPGQASNYQGITPGVSHKQDVIAYWGAPNVVRVSGEFESLHYFNGFVAESFLVKNDIVQAVTSGALGRQLITGSYIAGIASLSQTLGAPAIFTPTLLEAPIWVFPNYGLAISGLTAQLFEPTDLESYKEQWGRLPLEYDPFPLIPSVETVGIKPGVTTRAEVAQLLGTPDRIVFQDRGAPWWYFVEPDMLGRLNIFFSANDKVEAMYIAPFYQNPRPLHFEDMVKQYGLPEIVQLSPGFEGGRYERQTLVYPGRGLSISTVCSTPACDVVKRDARVVQKAYFLPKTLEEYEAPSRYLSPAYQSAYLEWHGFDE